MKPNQGALSVEPTLKDLRTVAPAFANYTEQLLDSGSILVQTINITRPNKK